MSVRISSDRDGGTKRQQPVVLIADPVTSRRKHLVRGPSRYAVLHAASLNEIYPTAEEAAPDFIAMSADFLIEPELEGVIRLADFLGTRVILYAEQGVAAIRSPLRNRLRLVQIAPQDRLDDLLARANGVDPQLDPGADETRLPDLVLIGASTGGIAAVETVLTAFPADCPPTLVVQHIRDGFVPSLVHRLNLRCRPRVVAAADSQPLQRGTIYFAADTTRHLTVSGTVSPRCLLVPAAPCKGHRPAVDPLFESALAWGDRVSAALLTGMGTDGAHGLGALRRAGACTIAQDRATSIVWGMPGAAAEAGAAQAILPIDRIGAALLAGHSQASVSAMRGARR